MLFRSEAFKFDICKENKEKRKQGKAFCKDVDAEDLLSEARVARGQTKKTKPRKMSLKKINNQARVMDLQFQMSNVLDGIGKYQTISIEDFVQAQNKGKIPIMVRRCIARVQPKMRKSQPYEESFTSAIQICTWVFQRHGFIRKGSRNYTMNKKGKDRNKYHRHRKDSSRFEQQFSRLYNSVFNPNKATKASKRIIQLGRTFKANDKWA